jgi:hypothetical protein
MSLQWNGCLGVFTRQRAFMAGLFGLKSVGKA